MNTPNERELLPCPFCGGASVDLAWQDDKEFSLIGCLDCWTQGPSKVTEAEAITAWNTRALSGQITTAPERDGVALAGELEDMLFSMDRNPSDREFAEWVEENSDALIAALSTTPTTGAGALEKRAFTFAFARGYQIAEETSRSCISAMDDAWAAYRAALAGQSQ